MNIYSDLTPELKAVWEKTENNLPKIYPFNTYAWHQTWLNTMGKSSELAIGFGNGCILPFIIENRTLRFAGGEEVSDYLDLIGTENRKQIALASYLDKIKNRFDKILLRNIPHESETVTFFRDHPVWKNRVTITREDTTPTITLPETFEEYLASLDRKSRHELRRKTKRFREDYPSVQFVSDDRVNMTPEKIFELMSYNQNKKIFLTQENRNFFRAILTLPFVRTDRLVDEDETIAFKIILTAPNTMYLYNSGYDTRYLGAGFMLTTESIRHAIDNNIRTYNFLQGNERYKYDFGARDYEVVRIESL